MQIKMVIGDLAAGGMRDLFVRNSNTCSDACQNQICQKGTCVKALVWSKAVYNRTLGIFSEHNDIFFLKAFDLFVK